jgi:hypothetical protein
VNSTLANHVPASTSQDGATDVSSMVLYLMKSKACYHCTCPALFRREHNTCFALRPFRSILRKQMILPRTWSSILLDSYVVIQLQISIIMFLIIMEDKYTLALDYAPSQQFGPTQLSHSALREMDPGHLVCMRPSRFVIPHHRGGGRLVRRSATRPPMSISMLDPCIDVGYQMETS